jgi:hypothetical protein
MSTEMADKYEGTVTKIGTRVDTLENGSRVWEIHDLSVDLKVHEAETRSDPATSLKAFLESKGHQVYRVEGTLEEILDGLRHGHGQEKQRLQWFHIVYDSTGVCQVCRSHKFWF